MQRVNQRVNSGYLNTGAPRPFPFEALPDLVLDYLVQPAFRKLLDPIIGFGLLVLLALGITHTGGLLVFLAVVLLTLRLWRDVSRMLGRIIDEIALLRYGLVVRAHVLRMRPYRSELGEIDGALFDCAIAVAPRRTYVGCVWLSDGAEAVQLAKVGRVDVLCLPLTPGTWRIVEDLRSEVRYDRRGPIAHIPVDIV